MFSVIFFYVNIVDRLITVAFVTMLSNSFQSKNYFNKLINRVKDSKVLINL